ncbi:MAG: hydrogenase expression/formation protein HypE [Vulcanimicrobiota bacterium]
MLDAHCPVPHSTSPTIQAGHGGGGRQSAELIRRVVLPYFDNPVLAALGDGAVVASRSGRLAMSTDSYVVNPLVFPGGDIGRLAVCGTVNDLAMMGALPEYLSLGLILEEGLELELLERVLASAAQAAQEAGVTIVTGDTKVVERGHGDGLFINTSGIGWIAEGVRPSPERARPGDALLLSGSLGDHGIAILSQRQGLRFQADLVSDCAPLAGLVQRLLDCDPDLHVLRDPTRGGLLSALDEISRASEVSFELEESALPIKPAVRSACELLGLDPLSIANEGKLICVASAERADRLLEAMRGHPLGREAAIIGRVLPRQATALTARTPFGTRRVLQPLWGDPLPRIC